MEAGAVRVTARAPQILIFHIWMFCSPQWSIKLFPTVFTCNENKIDTWVFRNTHGPINSTLWNKFMFFGTWKPVTSLWFPNPNTHKNDIEYGHEQIYSIQELG